jgi:hypothetical protein
MAEDDAMSTGMASLGLAGDASANVAADPDIVVPPAVMPPVITHSAAGPDAGGMAAGSIGIDESIPVPSVAPTASSYPVCWSSDCGECSENSSCAS